MKGDICTMGKSRTEQINSIDNQIEQLKIKKKELLVTAQKQERKNRNRRLIILGSKVEAALKYFGISLGGSEISEELQQAVYRYILLGRTLENVLGVDLTTDSVPRFEEFLKNQEERGHFVSNALFKKN